MDQENRPSLTVTLARSSDTFWSSVRMKVVGEPEAMYNSGESFYEAPNGVHEISANASQTKPAKFIAYFVCDRETSLSIPPVAEKGETR